MKRLEAFIATILKYGTILATLGLIGTVLLQIFARFFLAQAPPWTEEASRLCFIYAIAFAAGIALKEQYYVHWDLLYQRLSSKGKRTMDILIPSFVLILFLIMAVCSVIFVQVGMTESSPGMGMNMGLPFGSMFVLSTGLTLYAGLELKNVLQNNS